MAVILKEWTVDVVPTAIAAATFPVVDALGERDVF
jgi:hypothetical protein